MKTIIFFRIITAILLTIPICIVFIIGILQILLIGDVDKKLSSLLDSYEDLLNL